MKPTKLAHTPIKSNNVPNNSNSVPNSDTSITTFSKVSMGNGGNLPPELLQVILPIRDTLLKMVTEYVNVSTDYIKNGHRPGHITVSDVIKMGEELVLTLSKLQKVSGNVNRSAMNSSNDFVGKPKKGRTPEIRKKENQNARI